MNGMTIGQELNVIGTGTGRSMKQYFDYLETLRSSGVTNMFGAAPYLQREFGLDRNNARVVLMAWMESYK
jgi:hypothetical protein